MSRDDTSMRSGSPAITGARAPTSVVTTSSTRPTTVARRRTRRVSHSGPRRATSAGRGSARTLIGARSARPASASLVSNSGIEDDVGEVDGEVHEHVEARDADDHALDDGIVAPQHRGDDQAAEPGDVEDLLDDDRA